MISSSFINVLDSMFLVLLILIHFKGLWVNGGANWGRSVSVCLAALVGREVGFFFSRAVVVKHTHAGAVLCCPLVVFWLTATLGPAFRATLLRGNYLQRGHRLQI